MIVLLVTLVLAAAVTTALAVVVLGRTVVAGRQRTQCGSETLVGHVGVVRRPLDPVGQILINGELWRARRSWTDEDEPPPPEGEPVIVDRVQGLTLLVRAAETWEVEG